MENEIKRTIDSLTKEYCLEEKENLKTNLINVILIKIKNENSVFADLMKIVREFISSSKDLVRQSGLTLVLRVLERVANLKMDFNFYKNLVELGFNKMKDVVLAGVAVKIVYNVLLKIKSTFPATIFTNDPILNEHAYEVKEIVDKIFQGFSAESFNVPAYPLETRNYSYLIFEFMLESLEEFYHKRITDYLQLVVDAVDGEKDPRNILKMFALIEKISKKYFSDAQEYKDSCDQETMQDLCKSYFDTLEVYYPIEFTQPKNSPDKITPADLINALNACFASSDKFMEYLIEVLQEKFSTTSSEAKIEALKTIRAVNSSYSRKTLNNYLITLINLILNEVLNNDEELLHIDALITFKDLIKKLFEDQDNLNGANNFMGSQEELNAAENIEKNILKIFEKCEGLIFNSETVKNSYDSKDILVIVTEYNPQLRLQALQISIKLISHFLNDNKNYYLKNSNTILFYSLKNFSLDKAEKLAIKAQKDPNSVEIVKINDQRANNNNLTPDNDTNFENCNKNNLNNNKKEESENNANCEILNYFKSNTQIFKNLFYSLLKRDFTNNAKAEEIVFIAELISNFLIKTETLIFSEAEVKSIFDFIFSVWKSADEDTENSLSTCIVALTSKFNFLENYKTINLFFQTKIDYLLKMLRNKLEQIAKNSCCMEQLCSNCVSAESNAETAKSSKFPDKFKLDNSEFNYKEINKHLSLFIKFFTVEKISSFVLQETLNVYLKIKKNLVYFYAKLNQKFFDEAEKRCNEAKNQENLNCVYKQDTAKTPSESDLFMQISEAEFQNLHIKEEEKIYNLIILLYKNISENLMKIINQNIQILNLKTQSEDGGVVAKSKKGGCCGGKAKKTNKSQGSGCCSSGTQKAPKGGCCGGSAKHKQDESDFEADNKLIKNEEEQEQEHLKKESKKNACKKSSSGNCSNKKKHKVKTAEEENFDLILKNNSNILFEAIKCLIDSESVDNYTSYFDSNKNNTNVNSLKFYFKIFDAEIFQTSLIIIENYIKSDFINNDKKTELVNLIVNTLKKLNATYSSSNNNNESEISRIIQHHLVLFDSKITANGNPKDSICYDQEFKYYFGRVKKTFYLKFILKVTKIFLNKKCEDADFNSLNADNITNSKCKNTLKQKTKLRILLKRTEENIKQEITLTEQIQALACKISNLIASEIPKNFFNASNNSPIFNSNTIGASAKDYFSYLYMLSLDSELVNRFSDSSISSESNIAKAKSKNANETKNDERNSKLTGLTECEKQNRLTFSYQNFQKPENFFKQFANFNLNLLHTLIHFTNLNKLAYKLNGFLYFSLYFSFKNFSLLKAKYESISELSLSYQAQEKHENRMDIEEPRASNKDESDEFTQTSILIQTRLKEIYDDFLSSFGEFLDSNKNFKNLILKNLSEKETEQAQEFNLFSTLDVLSKVNNFLNFLCLLNDKNVFEILDKLIEKIFSLCNNLRDLETTMKKELHSAQPQPVNERLVGFYFVNAFFLKSLNGNINFDNISNPYFTIGSELTRGKLKINFLKFNKKIYESSFDKNKIYDYLLLFKKNSELDFMQIEAKESDLMVKGEYDINNLKLDSSNKEEKEKEEMSDFKRDLMRKAFSNSVEVLSCSNIYRSIVAKFILNFYLNFDFETLQENIDIILDHTLKFLSEGLCLEKAAKSLKNIIQYVGKNFLQRKGYGLHNIIDNLVKVLHSTCNLELKCDVLFIIYKIVQISKFTSGDNKFLRKISAKLKNLLNDKKRTIRKYAGLCINLLCLKHDE